MDKVLPGGGTTNTGNATRRFFREPEKVSEITGIDRELIERFAVILNIITSGEEINASKFEEYLRATEQRYLLLYSWHNIPPTVHKVLRHGAQVVRHLRQPIGDLSEEAQEARNKDYKRYVIFTLSHRYRMQFDTILIPLVRFREHHTRKTSRNATTEDIMHNLLISSDPVISSLRRDRVKKKNILPAAKEMLLNYVDAELSDEDIENDGNDNSDGGLIT